MTPAPVPPSHSIRKTGSRIAEQARGWAGSDGERLIFVAKAMLAAFTALWLAFRLGLDSPNTAMTTTFILALPSSGMVLEKSFYRLLGTVVGCSAALLMVALCPQQPVLLFLMLALWVGLCTCGAALYRNQQSYSFVLSGYTACMIAIPAIDAPSVVFALAVTRLTEVGLGVLCAAVVHDALFPRHQGRQLMQTVQARHARFTDFCRQVLEQRLAPAEAELHHLRFAADIAALESGRAAAFFEASHARAHTRQLHAYNNAFMTALTTFYTVHRLLHRLLHRPEGSPLTALLAPMQSLLAGALRPDAGQRFGPDLEARLEQAIATARQAQRQGSRYQAGDHNGSASADGTVNAASADDAADPADATDPQANAQRIDFDTAVELLLRFARDMAAFNALYHALAQQRRMQVSDPVAYSPRTPPAIVIASGVRAAVALLSGAALWYWLAWPAAGTAIVMTIVFSALASSSPRPTAMIRQVLIGFVVGAPLAVATEFLLVIRAGDYPMLVLATLPLFAVGAWLTSDPKRAGIGIGISLFSAQLVAPLNLMHYDPAAFLNTALALTVGVALAYAIFSVILPEHTMGQRAHVADALWREALGACRAALPRLKQRYDNRVRDLLAQLNAAAGPTPPAATREVVRLGLNLLEQGHAVIEMRQLMASIDLRHGPSAEHNALARVVGQLAAYFRAPSRASGEAALQAVLQAGPPLRAALQAQAGTLPSAALQPAKPHIATPGHAARLRTALADLHAIHTSLLDQLAQLTQLTLSVTLPAPPGQATQSAAQGDSRHAP